MKNIYILNHERITKKRQRLVLDRHLSRKNINPSLLKREQIRAQGQRLLGKTIYLNGDTI